MSKTLRIISVLLGVKKEQQEKHFDAPHSYIELKPVIVFCSKNTDWY